MTPERFQKIRDVFEAAIAVDGDRDRGRLLIERCGADDELRAEVEALLRSHFAPGDFLDSPALEGAAAAAGASSSSASADDPEARGDASDDDAMTGRRIGAYVIRRIIARGGMGIVYEAEQDQPRRTVALKIMRQAVCSRAALRRFQYEGEILGRLRHPNIAHIHEAGMHYEESIRQGGEGLPYFAMEFIPGALPITKFAVQHDLSIRERLELFIEICDAVHHGHQKGVIHRDLKPANILVDIGGEAKVIDFGVARATDSDIAVTTQQTSVGDLIGTLQYMSPEQCDGDPRDLDSRSDVYSLGVVLYEVLSGAPAYDTGSSSIYQATRIIKETIPPPLSSIDRRFRGDLETIVAKAMEKDRDRRYQSAESLRNDIARYLAGEPIEARRASAWINVTRWMGGHPIASAAAGSVMVAGRVFLVSGAVLWHGLVRPDRFRIASDGSVAHLVSVFGKPLATFGDESFPNAVLQARVVDRPARFGGGRVALFVVQRGERSTDHQLWMCDLDRLEDPTWQTRPDEPHHPDLAPAWGG